MLNVFFFAELWQMQYKKWRTSRSKVMNCLSPPPDLEKDQNDDYECELARRQEQRRAQRREQKRLDHECEEQEQEEQRCLERERHEQER